MDCNLTRQLFTSMVRPHLEYANVVWHEKDIQLIDRVQHRATRMVPGLAKLAYKDRLRKLNLPSLAFRRSRGDIIEVFKYMKGNYKDDCSVMLPRHEHGRIVTRGHGFKLAKRECRSQLRANFFPIDGSECLE